MLNDNFIKAVLSQNYDASGIEGFTEAEFKKLAESALRGSLKACSGSSTKVIEAGDVFQDVVVKLLENKEYFKAVEKQKSVLYSTARNCANDAFKRFKDWKAMPDSLVRVPEENTSDLQACEPPDGEEERERINRVLKLLKRAKGRFRSRFETVRCRYDREGKPLSLRETAKKLGIAKDTVSGRLTEIRREAKAMYEDDRRQLFGPHKTRKQR